MTAGAAVVPPSPPALMPSGLVGESTSAISVRNDGRQIGARHAVIHERSGERLPGIRIEIDLLPHRLPYPLRDSAVGLAVHDQRIDAAADIVDAGVAGDLDPAGVGVDLDLADRRAVGKHRLVHLVVGDHRNAVLERLRQLVTRRLAREFEKIESEIGIA